mmetsp:Transcript_22849/g.49433  ORF Transcript_22849/g.49433 Transcript_22849/m.49433 type:complete len:428 (+) Transcript_22849:305-1588(+)|eukprot:CAMPEP_0172315014 /NCGR_PEP_ID=MMETSP1058-20130122/23854_1 /TAXON_ID=83371 /ORGANISM="Detonula confervacea, Strain CCMP 353" /LENGTH=427 /DNA_ID=CAMNT_0013028999 /DNA_START=227 /DNA_END=1510 /DNA_ORIENTATION=-
MALPALRTGLTYTKYAAGTIFAASMTSAWYYRPIADTNTKSKQPILENNNDRANESFCAPYTSPPWSRERVPILLEWARRISIGVTTVAIRLLMTTYGKYEIKDDEHYHNFLETVLGGNDRIPNQGLITVSNHRSLFDDPGIVSCLLPLPISIQPKYNRWALCSQEYCFNDALPGLIKGYIGAGQVLPICRGAGINQKLFLDFGRHLACGEWCHMFPEGGVWQWDELGGRRKLPSNAINGSSSDFDSGPNNNVGTDENENSIRIIPATLEQKALSPSTIGKLKWGVGKLIAHAPITPKVIPFAHRGMERLFPQDENTGKTKLRDNLLASLLPTVLGGDSNDKLHVRVGFGKEIVFDDLIQEHESSHGKLWKYCGKINAEEQYDKGQQNASVHGSWDSSEEERALYSKIVRRIESRLDTITREVCKEN